MKCQYFIVDVFATNRYEGNQLGVFIDLDNLISSELMQKIARELNFAETAFIKNNETNKRFTVRIFTPEHEVPFAGHPSIGASYIIARFLLPSVPEKLTLALVHSDIDITISQPESIESSLLFMRQAQPEFREQFAHEEVAIELGIPIGDLDMSLPIQEISTGLPYIIIPLNSLRSIDNLALNYESFGAFLTKRHKCKATSSTGHSTSLFFFTSETYEKSSTYNTRMLLLENGRLSEDAATGSANGCFLAYLIKHLGHPLNATVEQGFQINRKSYIYLNGHLQNDMYELNVGGRTQLISEGVWHL